MPATPTLLEAILDDPRRLVVLLDAEGRVGIFNGACEAATGFAAHEMLGRALPVALVGEIDGSKLEALRAEILAGAPATEHRSEWTSKTGEHCHIQWWTSAIHGEQEEGAPEDQFLLLGHLVQTEATEPLNSLEVGDERVRRVVEHMPVMMGAFDRHNRIIEWNRECERVTGFDRSEIVGNPNFADLLYPDLAYRKRMLSKWSSKGDDYRDWEWEVATKDGRSRTIAWSKIPHHVPVPDWATWGIGIDVTEQRRSDERQALLVHELDHRTKNLLTNTLALAEQTAAGSTSIEQFEEAFGSRIRTMAGVHEALARTRWEDVELNVIVRTVLAPLMQGPTERVFLDGPPVRLPAATALPIALSLHELGTNAVKYGALHVEHGTVHLNWLRGTDDTLQILWTESGVTEIQAPTAEGTGLGLITGLIRYQLRGQVEQRFEPPGVCARLRIPLGPWKEGEAPAPPTVDESRRTGGEAFDPSGVRVLVLEDEVLQARAMMRTLKALGYDAVGPASTVAGALALAEREPIDAAVLDVQIGNDRSDAVARTLMAEGCAVLLTTGFGGESAVPSDLAHIPRLTKPVDRTGLAAALRGALSRSSRPTSG